MCRRIEGRPVKGRRILLYPPHLHASN
jgi:hypothetical protein